MRELSVLGPIELDIPPVARRCLAALALHAPQTVPADRLIDAVWGHEPPPTAHKALQNAVVSIRRALGPGAVEHRNGGYRLLLALDRDRFERLARAGAATEALRLWRGDPWQDLDSPAALADAARLRALVRRLEEDSVEQRLDVPAAEQLVLSDPLSERRWMLLMRALYRSGRQSEALRAAMRARESIATVGLEVGPVFVHLERAVASHDPALGPPMMPAPAVEHEARQHGMEALRARRYADAVRWLRLAGSGPDVLSSLGEAQFASGEAAAARATFLAAVEAAENGNDTSALGAAAVGVAATVIGPGDRGAAQGIGSVRERIERAGSADVTALARLAAAASLAEARLYEGPLAARVVEATLEQARQAADDVAFATSLKAACLCAARPHDAERQLELADELAIVAARLDDEEAAAIARCTRHQAQLQLGSESHHETLAQIRRATTTAAHAAARGYYELWIAGEPTVTGDLAAADREIANFPAAMAGYVGNVPFIHAAYPSYLFTVRWMQGRLVEVLPLLEPAARAMPGLVTWTSALAMARAAGGEVMAAAALTRELVATPVTERVAPALWAATTWHLAHAIALVDDAELADLLLPQLEPLATRHATYASVYLGSYAHLIGLLHAVAGRRAEAVHWLERAVAAHHAVGAAWWESSSAANLARLAAAPRP